MTRRVSAATVLGGLALVIAGAAMDVNAQRGASAGKGQPPVTGKAEQRGKPATPGAATGRSAPTGNVAVQLRRNATLASRLQALFPAGTDLQKESAGFPNLGQFVAAAHASQNLGIRWTDLKAKMTGNQPASLGRAIHDLKPQADIRTELARAQMQANTDIKESMKTAAPKAS